MIYDEENPFNPYNGSATWFSVTFVIAVIVILVIL